MGAWSIWHWLILLVIVLAVFGTKKLRNIGPDLGSAMREFKKAFSGDDAEDKDKDKDASDKDASDRLKADEPEPTAAERKSASHDSVDR